MRIEVVWLASQNVTIPPITWSEQVWQPQAGRYTDTTMIPDYGRTYRALIPPRIADLQVRVPTVLAQELDDAEAALRNFDTQHGIDIAHFAALLLHSEALSSSQIEQVDAGARQVLAAEIGESSRTNALLITSASRAMQTALSDNAPVDAALAQRIHLALLHDYPRAHPGEYRTEPIWVGGQAATSPLTAEFVAPPENLVPELMDDWGAYAARRDIPPLIQAMIAHAQFETIHPFNDGNGRTGRALLQAMLQRRHVATRAVVPISSGLLADTNKYFDALSAYRNQDAAPILSAAVEATHRSIANARQLVAEVQTIQARHVEAAQARRGSRTAQLISFAAKQPVFTPRLASEQLGVRPSNLQRDLDRLVAAGILRKSASEHRGGGKVYRADDYLAALDRFTARARRSPAR